MKCVILSVVSLAILLQACHAVPILYGRETVGTQHGVSFAGVDLFNVGGGYTKGAGIGGYPHRHGVPYHTIPYYGGVGGFADGATAFNIGLGPLQYRNRNAGRIEAGLMRRSGWRTL